MTSLGQGLDALSAPSVALGQPADSGATSNNKKKKKKKKKPRKKAVESPLVEPEGFRAFEVERQWCVWQLELGTRRPDCDAAGRKKLLGMIAVLNDENVARPAKIQKMRFHLGDYKKMMRELGRTSFPDTLAEDHVEYYLRLAKGKK